MSFKLRHLVVVLAAWSAVGSTCLAAAGDIAIINARIYTSPDAQAIERGTLMIHRGEIASIKAGSPASVPPSATVIDAHDAVVTAGFWNSHVHLLTPTLLHARDRSAPELAAELQKMFTHWGFTTVFDLGSSFDNTQVIRRRITSGEVAGPHVLTVGGPFFPEHGTPIYARDFLRDNGLPSFEVANAGEARMRARRELAAGTDAVKIFAGAVVGGDVGVLPMPLDIATTVVGEAHRLGKPAFAHPSNSAGVEVAIRSGVDVLAHTAPEMGPWGPELVARLRAHYMALIPTLTLFEVENKKRGAPADQIARVDELTTQQLAAFVAAHGLVLFGTDVGYIDEYDTTQEYRLMSRVLNWRQILATLTTNPTQRFTHRTGTLAVGEPADLVVLDGDPAEDVAAFARVRYTIRDGSIVYQRD